MSRPVSEVAARCQSALKDRDIISVVEGSSSPTAAYYLVFQKTGSAAMAKSGRWLAVLRRDYPGDYKHLTRGGEL
jgi:hypothetical protein